MMLHILYIYYCMLYYSMSEQITTTSLPSIVEMMVLTCFNRSNYPKITRKQLHISGWRMIEISLRVPGTPYWEHVREATDDRRLPCALRGTCAKGRSKMGGFHELRYPEMDGLQGTSY